MKCANQPDGLHVELTAHESFRIDRGDRVEFSGDVGYGLNRLVVTCESPKGVPNWTDAMTEMRRLRRELAVKRTVLRSGRSWYRDITPGIAYVIPSIGDSAARLATLLIQLRDTLANDFNPMIVVADDGGGYGDAKECVTSDMGAVWTPNHGVPGIPGNLNHAVYSMPDSVRHIVILDDGAMVHHEWQVQLAALIKQLDSDSKLADVVMIGSAHIQSWMIALAGHLGDRWTNVDWCNGNVDLCDLMVAHFYETFDKPHSLTFGDLLNEKMLLAEPVNQEVADFIRYNREHCVSGDEHSLERLCREVKYLCHDHWPSAKQMLRTNWSPGAQGLIIRRDFLRDAGGFSRNVLAYEQLLAVKAAEMGKRVCSFDCPPFLHMPSLGFVEAGRENLHREYGDIGDVCQEFWGKRDPFEVIEGLLA